MCYLLWVPDDYDVESRLTEVTARRVALDARLPRFPISSGCADTYHVPYNPLFILKFLSAQRLASYGLTVTLGSLLTRISSGRTQGREEVLERQRSHAQCQWEAAY